MLEAPTKAPLALHLGRASLRWIDLATLAAMHTRQRADAPIVRGVKARLAVWRPLDEFKARFAFVLGSAGRLYQWDVFTRLHQQGFIIAGTHLSEVSLAGQSLACFAESALPAPLPSQAYAQVMDMLYSARRRVANGETSDRLAREIIRAHVESTHQPS